MIGSRSATRAVSLRRVPAVFVFLVMASCGGASTRARESSARPTPAVCGLPVGTAPASIPIEKADSNDLVAGTRRRFVGRLRKDGWMLYVEPACAHGAVHLDINLPAKVCLPLDRIVEVEGEVDLSNDEDGPDEADGIGFQLRHARFLQVFDDDVICRIVSF